MLNLLQISLIGLKKNTLRNTKRQFLEDKIVFEVYKDEIKSTFEFIPKKKRNTDNSVTDLDFDNANEN